uniref:LysR family transcriptional regulator n=1 Tax=Clostridioides difficile TaxID=1496 RepID=A0A381I4B1_CLODI|nr:LysR family transcriptional regulator [Clostridioides difficile]
MDSQGGWFWNQRLFRYVLSVKEIIPKSMMVFGSNYAVKESVRNNLGITIVSNLVTSLPVLKQ